MTDVPLNKPCQQLVFSFASPHSKCTSSKGLKCSWSERVSTSKLEVDKLSSSWGTGHRSAVKSKLVLARFDITQDQLFAS